eukprot:5514246-Pyramimonas_sp.AAC.1
MPALTIRRPDGVCVCAAASAAVGAAGAAGVGVQHDRHVPPGARGRGGGREAGVPRRGEGARPYGDHGPAPRLHGGDVQDLMAIMDPHRASMVVIDRTRAAEDQGDRSLRQGLYAEAVRYYTMSLEHKGCGPNPKTLKQGVRPRTLKP